MHGVMGHLHAVLGIYALGRYVIFYEHVGSLVEGISELEMG